MKNSHLRFLVLWSTNDIFSPRRSIDVRVREREREREQWKIEQKTTRWRRSIEFISVQTPTKAFVDVIPTATTVWFWFVDWSEWHVDSLSNSLGSVLSRPSMEIQYIVNRCLRHGDRSERDECHVQSCLFNQRSFDERLGAVCPTSLVNMIKCRQKVLHVSFRSSGSDQSMSLLNNE